MVNKNNYLIDDKYTFIVSINDYQEHFILNFFIDTEQLKNKKLFVNYFEFDEDNNEIKETFSLNLINAKNICLDDEIFDENDFQLMLLSFYLNEEFYEIYLPLIYKDDIKNLINSYNC